MITGTIEELIVCKETLEHLNTSPMPAVTAFRFSDIVNELNQELAGFKREVGAKRASFTLDEGKQLEATQQHDLDQFVEELLRQSFEVAGERIEVKELGPLVALAPAQAALLHWLIFEERNG
jgi:hypothetical protein